MSPVVSVLLPSYNHARYLRAAIDSVLAQSLDALELIIIDDASADESWSIIEAIDDPRVKASRHDTNAGAHATLNEALAQAGGEFVAILNSDDIYSPGRLQRIVDEMRAHDAGFAFSDLRFIDDAGTPCPDHERARDYRDACAWCAPRPATDWFLSGNLAVTTSNFVFRRSLAGEIGEFRPLRYTHDWAWALEAAARTPLVWLRGEALLDYRVHPSNTLSEGDRWRHIHENAFIQIVAIARIDRIMQAQGDQRPIDDPICALLKNPSGPPAVTLALLLAPYLRKFGRFTVPTKPRCKPTPFRPMADGGPSNSRPVQRWIAARSPASARSPGWRIGRTPRRRCSSSAGRQWSACAS